MVLVYDRPKSVSELIRFVRLVVVTHLSLWNLLDEVLIASLSDCVLISKLEMK